MSESDNVFCAQLQCFHFPTLRHQDLHSWHAENCYEKSSFLCKRSKPPRLVLLVSCEEVFLMNMWLSDLWTLASTLSRLRHHGALRQTPVSQWGGRSSLPGSHPTLKGHRCRGGRAGIWAAVDIREPSFLFPSVEVIIPALHTSLLLRDYMRMMTEDMLRLVVLGEGCWSL